MRVFVDVREPFEYASGHVEGAINVPPSELMSGHTLSSIPKDSEIIVYCRTGSRSNVAMNILRAQGYTNLTNGINQQQVETSYLK